MSLKRSLLEMALRGLSRAAPSLPQPPAAPDSIFVLRNNDMGDLLVVTPLFEALRLRFPETRIVAGVGPWNLSILENNPHVDEVVSLRAPWHNKYVQPQGILSALRYILFDSESKALASRRFSIGMDVLGSPQGSLLFLRARIPYRVGVKGYAGGHSATQRHLMFDPSERVGRSALRLAQLLGATSLPDSTPQLFLRDGELAAAEQLWSANASKEGQQRLLMAPGAGLPSKRWPLEKWRALARCLDANPQLQLALVGAKDDAQVTNPISSSCPRAANLAGELSLRQTLALVAQSDAVLCHSSMILHAAAAWNKPTLALLGPAFNSPEAHAQQWGHPKCKMIGEASPREAAAVLDQILAQTCIEDCLSH